MTSVLIQYTSTAASTVTISLAGLANGSARQGGFIDNSSSQNLDALLRIKTQGTAGSTGTLDVYLYGSAESGSPVYTDGATGSDAAFTVASLLNCVLFGQVVMSGANSVVAGPWGVAEKFGGSLPQKWGIICVNNSGAALDATAGNHVVVWQGVFGQIQ